MGKSSGHGYPLTHKRLTLSEMRPVPRRGLCRSEAALYVGLSPSKFDQLVSDGRMPRPIGIDRRKVWDLHKLDAAFDALGEESDTTDQTWNDFGQPRVKR
jgi:predicted DNA-binding transcriptional regulator AlpA